MKSNVKILKVISIISLIASILGISIGFAAMSRTLSINGQVKVIPGDWDLKFENVEFSDNGTAAYETTDTSDPDNPKPNITGTTFSNYEIVLTKPGDKGTYTIDVKNDGSIDAQLTGVTWNTGTLVYTGLATDPTKKANDERIVRENVSYTLTWSDGTAITTGSDLDAGTSKQIVVKAEYDKDATEYPSAPVIITGNDLTLTYESK